MKKQLLALLVASLSLSVVGNMMAMEKQEGVTPKVEEKKKEETPKVELKKEKEGLDKNNPTDAPSKDSVKNNAPIDPKDKDVCTSKCCVCSFVTDHKWWFVGGTALTVAAVVAWYVLGSGTSDDDEDDDDTK